MTLSNIKKVILNIIIKIRDMLKLYVESIESICGKDPYIKNILFTHTFLEIVYLDSNKKARLKTFSYHSIFNVSDNTVSDIDIISIRNINCYLILNIVYEIHNDNKGSLISHYKNMISSYEKIINLKKIYTFFDFSFSNIISQNKEGVEMEQEQGHKEYMEYYDKKLNYSFEVKGEFNIDYKEIFELLKKGNEE